MNEAASLAAGPLRVLVVDDEAPARARLRDLLGDVAGQQPNALVGMAANGVEALRLLEDAAADVVLADIRMPVMDGVELARHLARLPEPPALVFVTAYDQYAVQAFELAAVDYLLKPVRAQRLAEALERVRVRRVPMSTSVVRSPRERRSKKREKSTGCISAGLLPQQIITSHRSRSSKQLAGSSTP